MWKFKPVNTGWARIFRYWVKLMDQNLAQRRTTRKLRARM
jgi:hypothetical protein